MRYGFLYSLLFTVFVSCTSANDYLTKAEVEIDKENYREAIRLLDNAIEKKKYFSEAYIHKAYCYTQLNLDDSAISIYNYLLYFSPNNTLALYNMGLCKYRQSKFGEAIAYFNDALVTKGYNPEDTSKVQSILEYTPIAKELMGESDKFDVPFQEIFYMAGFAYYEDGKIGKAYNYFNWCLRKNYNLAETYYMMGLCWLVSKKNEKACEFFKKSSAYNYLPAKEQLDKICKDR